MSFLKISVKHVNNKEKKIYICDEIFKCINNDLINVFSFENLNLIITNYLK